MINSLGNSRELVINAQGTLQLLETQRTPVTNPQAVLKDLLGTPGFFLPITEQSHIHLHQGALHYVQQIKEIPIFAWWDVFREEDITFETATFSQGALEAVRTYVPILPTFIILRVPADRMNDPYPVRPDALCNFWLLSAIRQIVKHANPQNPEEQTQSEQLSTYILPFGNTHSNGLLCTGPLKPAQNFFELTTGAIESWKENKWNGDLFDAEIARLCKKLVRFDPETGAQLAPAAGLELDQLMLRGIPSLAKEVLDQLKRYVPVTQANAWRQDT